MGYTEHGLEGVVLLLTEQLADKNYLCRQFFNSPQLQYNLLKKGILCAGMVCFKKKLPKSNPLLDEKNIREMLCFESEKIFFTKWIDNKAVNMS